MGTGPNPPVPIRGGWRFCWPPTLSLAGGRWLILYLIFENLLGRPAHGGFLTEMLLGKRQAGYFLSVKVVDNNNLCRISQTLPCFRSSVIFASGGPF